MKTSTKILRSVLAFSLVFVFSTKQVSAITFDQIKEVTTTSFTQVLEKIELAFTFKEESKIQVMAKHAERRVNWAEESFDNGDTQRAQDYLDEYVQTKEDISDKLDQVDEEMIDDFQEQTIDENRIIEEFKDDLQGTLRDDVEGTQTQVLEKTWEVVGEIQGENAAENFVERIYAPGTGPGGESTVIIEEGELRIDPGINFVDESKVIIEGGELKFAPGTESGGDSNVIEGSAEIKTDGQEFGNNTQTFSGND